MDNRNSVKKICPACGVDFLVPKCREETAKFCSAKCKYASREKPKYITKRCKHCGKDFETRPSTDNDYCSKGCFHLSTRKRIKKNCPVCKKEFEVKKSYARIQCCSLGCGRAYQKNIYKNKATFDPYIYSEKEYRDAREKILQRDKYSCMFCSSTEYLVVHHKIPVRNGGGNEQSNLVTLCRSCHMSLHGTKEYNMRIIKLGGYLNE